MTQETQSNATLVESRLEGCGSLLKQAREQAGLSLDQVSSQLRMPARVLQSLENEDWQKLGAPVFVRGQLRSYARLLKVDIEPYLQQAQLQSIRPAELVSHNHTPQYQRVMESVGRRVVYVVITAAIAVPVWMATQSHMGGQSAPTASLDVIPSPETTTSGVSQVAGPEQAVASKPQAAPYVASLTPPLSRGNKNLLTLRMSGDSWVQINAPDGSSVEKGLLKAGSERSFETAQIGRVVLGNAEAVEVQQSGSTVDMTPYKRANVARFTVSSDGSLVPVTD